MLDHISPDLFSVISVLFVNYTSILISAVVSNMQGAPDLQSMDQFVLIFQGLQPHRMCLNETKWYVFIS